MSYFLWVEDFDGQNPKITSSEIFGDSILNENCFADDKKILKKKFDKEGIFIELSFQDGLAFIRENLNKVDYIILDIDLPAFSKGDEINESVIELLEKFESYEKLDNETEDEELLSQKCNELKCLAGFYLYTELVVELGFPKQHILFCSNHGENTKSIQEAFKTAKITLPRIYEKANSEVQVWVKERYENPYSRLRRGIIEGCNYIANNLEHNSLDLSFNSYISEDEKQVLPDDALDYLEVLKNMLPINEPKDSEKATFYKIFIRTLSHEWEATDPKKIKGLAWIMKNTRNWIVHNSALFSEIDEQMVAYLFMVNTRLMFNYNNTIQSHERILLSLFSDDALQENIFKNQNNHSIIYKEAEKSYVEIQNLISKTNNVRDAIRFSTLANNIQEIQSPYRNDKKLFSKLLYQMFWHAHSNAKLKFNKGKGTVEIDISDYIYPEPSHYLFEIARHIRNRSFPQ